MHQVVEGQLKHKILDGAHSLLCRLSSVIRQTTVASVREVAWQTYAIELSTPFSYFLFVFYFTHSLLPLGAAVTTTTSSGPVVRKRSACACRGARRPGARCRQSNEGRFPDF